MMTRGKDTTVYGCGHKEINEVWGVDHNYNVSFPCYDCQVKLIGTLQTVVRYGDIPAGGKSYNHRDGKSEIGVSCYLESMRPRPWFTDRPKHIFKAVIVGWGSDDEPLIDAKTIRK
jgi:hypothetical protein